MLLHRNFFVWISNETFSLQIITSGWLRSRTRLRICTDSTRIWSRPLEHVTSPKSSPSGKRGLQTEHTFLATTTICLWRFQTEYSISFWLYQLKPCRFKLKKIYICSEWRPVISTTLARSSTSCRTRRRFWRTSCRRWTPTRRRMSTFRLETDRYLYLLYFWVTCQKNIMHAVFGPSINLIIYNVDETVT